MFFIFDFKMKYKIVEYIEAIADNEAGTRTYYPARAEHDVFTFLVVDHP